MKHIKLKSMYGYEDASKKKRELICNGCGTGGWKGWLVPDTIYGLSVANACHVHDWMYHFGMADYGKKLADEMFLDNMYTIIDAHSWWFRWVRKRRAYKYFLAVEYFGEKAYMANKNGVNEDIKVTAKDLEAPQLKPFRKNLKAKMV